MSDRPKQRPRTGDVRQRNDAQEPQRHQVGMIYGNVVRLRDEVDGCAEGDCAEQDDRDADTGVAEPVAHEPPDDVYDGRSNHHERQFRQRRDCPTSWRQ